MAVFMVFVILVLVGQCCGNWHAVSDVPAATCDQYYVLHSVNAFSSIHITEQTSPNILLSALKPDLIKSSECVRVLPMGCSQKSDISILEQIFNTHRSTRWILRLPQSPINCTSSVTEETQRQVLRVIYPLQKPFIFPNLPLRGVDIDVWRVVGEEILKREVVFIQGETYNQNIVEVGEGRADVAIGLPSFVLPRYRLAEVSHAVSTRLFMFGYRRPRRVDPLSTVIRPFNSATWALATIAILATWLVLLLLNQDGKMTVFHLSALSWAPAIGLSLPATSFPQSVPARTRTMLWFSLPTLMALSMFYRSNLLRHLITVDFELPLDTFEQLLDRKLIFMVPHGTAVPHLLKNSPRETLRRVYWEALVGRNGWYHSLEKTKEVLAKEADGSAAFITTPEIIVGRRHVNRLGRDPIDSHSTGYYFTMNAHFEDQANRGLALLLQSGIFAHFYDKARWEQASPEREYARTHNEHGHPVTLGLRHFGPTGLLPLYGLIVGTIVLVIEICVAKFL